MALNPRLELRQSQQLVMTPQLQQAIKLLQLSNLELAAFVESELERNPLLETEEFTDAGSAPSAADDAATAGSRETANESHEGKTDDGWSELDATADPAGVLDTDYENVDPEAGVSDLMMAGQLAGTSRQSVTRGLDDGEASNLEEYVSDEITLKTHLEQQLGVIITDPVERLIARFLIDMVDEAGYLTEPLEPVAEKLAAPMELVHSVLEKLQTFDPPGVFARSLSECLALQLRDQNRYDPRIAALLDNLQLLAQHNMVALRRVCDCDAEEVADMVAEIRRLNPKPGLKFGHEPVQPVVPDVLVRPRSDGGWHVELNSETLPRVLVNQTYYTSVSRNSKHDKDKSYLQECLQTANWLVKSLDQRARTILKVSEEIVRQQDAFFAHGVQYLRPLNLKTVADAISMHESTVSRVTSNKYMATPRGILELKYFFTSAIASAADGEAHSSESVRYRIKQMIDCEPADDVLSDDKIVEKLKADGIDIARRTVAKYREAMRIPSSVQRRREKRMGGKAA